MFLMPLSRISEIYGMFTQTQTGGVAVLGLSHHKIFNPCRKCEVTGCSFLCVINVGETGDDSITVLFEQV